MDVDGSVDVSQSDASWTVDVGTVPIKWKGDEPLKVNIKNLEKVHVALEDSHVPIRFIAVPVPTPFAINIANVEYCRGRINPETNRYELKIGLTSGRDLSLEGEAAVSFLSLMSGYTTEEDEDCSLDEKYRAKTRK